jgi:hypothetical protein
VNAPLPQQNQPFRPPHRDPLQVRRSLIVRIDQAMTPLSFGGDPAAKKTPAKKTPAKAGSKC